MGPPLTKSGTSRLSEVAKHLVKPAGIVSTGWTQVARRCRDLGIGFDGWQQGAGRLILSKTADGKYAATVGGVGLSLPRQVGKTYLVGAISFALCIDIPGLTVIWTSHHARTAAETFLAMQGFARRRKVAPHIEAVYRGSGDEEIRFRNGSRILFGARERGFGRGFAGVDILVCDEAQILTDKALDNMLATLNQPSTGNALPLFMGTPPTPTDPSEAFRRMRADALAGELADGVWIECGADEDADPDDRAAWAKANPSYPHRTPVTSMLRLRKKLTLDSWKREGLGIWDSDGAGVLPGWGNLFVDAVLPPPAAIGLAVSLDSAWGSIASADLWDDERVNLSAVDRRPGTAWLVGEAKRIQTERGCAVVVDEKCPDGTLVEALDVAGVDVTVMKLADLVAACSEMVNRVRQATVTHQRTTELDAAIDVADWRDVGDGRRVFGRKKSAGPVDMLEAATAAMWGALNGAPLPAIHGPEQQEPDEPDDRLARQAAERERRREAKWGSGRDSPVTTSA